MPYSYVPASTPPTTTSSSSAYPILYIPNDIASQRRAFFTLKQDLYLSVKQFNQLQAYITNQWSNQGKTRNKYSVNHIFKYCFQRKQQLKSRGEGIYLRLI